MSDQENMSNVKKEKAMQKPLIHGENIFRPVDKVPKGKVSKHKLYIAGHSESGHHHVLESETEFEVIEPENLGDSIFIRLLSPAKVVHKKSFDIHETKVLQPGVYERVIATEYDPFQKVIRRVYD
jgi:hypothetical protein